MCCSFTRGYFFCARVGERRCLNDLIAIKKLEMPRLDGELPSKAWEDVHFCCLSGHPMLPVALKQTFATLQNDFFFLNAFLNPGWTSLDCGRIRPQVFLTSAEATAVLLSCKTDAVFLVQRVCPPLRALAAGGTSPFSHNFPLQLPEDEIICHLQLF